jgi:hypothetical protein
MWVVRCLDKTAQVDAWSFNLDILAAVAFWAFRRDA